MRTSGEEPPDPYGFGPGARISVGGHFPPTTAGRAPEPPAPAQPADAAQPADPARSAQPTEHARADPGDGAAPAATDGELHAVALVARSLTEHAVPWTVAVPRTRATTACGVVAVVADISRSRVIWMPGVLMCRECAAVVTGGREDVGERP
ncbi:hypothetical protein [Sphaerisporangium siamense]|uniref:Pyruvate/2-oxoglutarate dehydrogenase complex dihydrolipoamide acyltransferase (E2) component n=1 Tax=Sphaerisporangium siamense TaxID=795645 RepID=A0A7W7D5K7_9ACTN|nr:hypothetical protein [Sphaerisporangium siamense]MBB4699725.1 pyruvate/2-oxoglutarate dehydrogenase complex dihydrolipoamide acyltransferase (E2) component [Sphaerisporangium siamense]